MNLSPFQAFAPDSGLDPLQFVKEPLVHRGRHTVALPQLDHRPGKHLHLRLATGLDILEHGGLARRVQGLEDLVPLLDILFTQIHLHRPGDCDDFPHGRIHEFPGFRGRLQGSVIRPQDGRGLVGPHVDHVLEPEAADHVRRDYMGDPGAVEEFLDATDPVRHVGVLSPRRKRSAPGSCS